ncbi:hypothetical protein HPT29_021450 [Microvirga terrae]|uniref:Uncharacterized protein n=1 Tax=Microvirga terrae TaxID=2740529 RepID=A0ABY5RS16_9HYPH|nr:hypothetical protein [Microvirga terrae]UVF19002.1 hypothetical protein HPT29_021450 [Microvirga terrae]
MKGSLAVWYEPLHIGDVKGRPPEVELHFNLWRDLNIEVNFFDVGILFKDVQDLKEFSFFLPIELELSDIEDLFPKMSEGETLNAVFNDVVEIMRNDGSHIITTTRNGPFHTLHRVEPIADFTLKAINIDSERRGAVVVLSREFCQRIRGMPGDHYIRLRFRLEKKKGELFSSYFAPEDAPLLSSFGLIEITEFRLNERRSYPKAIVSLSNAGSPRLSAIHYFLVRDLRYELVASHTDFRKVRRLEADLWQHYINDLPANAGNRMVIYHWKADGKDGKGIEDFVALANFRVPQPNLPIYLVLLLVFGALGGVLQDSMVAGFQGLFGLFSAEDNEVPSTLLAGAILLGAAFFVLKSKAVQSRLRKLTSGV